MVTIQEAKQKVTQAKTQVEQQQKKANEVITNLTQAKSKLPDVRKPRYVRSLPREKRRQIYKAGQDISKRINVVERYKQNLAGSIQNIKEYEQKIKQAELSQKAQAELKRDYEIGQKYALKGLPSAYLSKRQRKFYHMFKEKLNALEEYKKMSDAILKSTGLPAYKFKDLSSEELSKLSESSLKELKKAGVIDFKSIPKIDTSKMDRGDKSRVQIDEFNKIKRDSETKFTDLFKGDLFPIVSAKDIHSTQQPPKIKNSLVKDNIFIRGTTISTDVKGFFEKKLKEAKPKPEIKTIINVPKAVSYIGNKLVGAGEFIGGALSKITKKEIKIPVFIGAGGSISTGITVGESASKVRGGISKVGEMTSKGWENTFRVMGIPTKKEVKSKEIPIYLKETLINNEEAPTKINVPSYNVPTIAGLFSKSTGAIPSGAGYVVAPYSMLSVDILSGTQKMTNVDKEYQKELERQYNANKQRLLKERLGENERIPTKKEFEKEVGANIKKDLKKNIALFDVLLPTVLLGGGIAGSVVRRVTRPKIFFKDLPVKETDSLTLIKKPTARGLSSKGQITEFPAISISAGGESGKKTIVKNWLGMTKYHGSPYGKVGAKEYKKTLKYLMKKGYSEKQTREMLRLHKPKPELDIFKGNILDISNEQGSILKSTGVEVIKPLDMEIKGVKSAKGMSKINIINQEVVPISSKESIELSKFAEKSKSFFEKNKKFFSKLSQRGKTETLRGGVSGVKKVGEIGEYEVFKEGSISRKLIPAKRKMDISKGITLAEKGEPEVIIDLDELLGVKKLKGFKGGGKKSSKSYLQQLYDSGSAQKRVVENIKKLIPKPKAVERTIGKVKTIPSTKQKRVLFPLISASQPTKQTSAYYGKGVYERTSGLGGTAITSKTTQSNLGVSKELIKQKQIEKTQTKLSFRPLQIEKTKTKLKQMTKPKQKSIQLEKLSQVPKERTKVREILNIKTKQAQRLKQKMKQSLISRTTTTKTSTQSKPKPKNIITPDIKEAKPKATPKKPKITKDMFKVFVKKFGKDIKLGEFETLESAKKKLKKELTGTLRASGFVKKGEKKVKLNLGFGFRPSKKDIFRVVQRKTARFGTGGETSEAQFFRKTKRRKIKFI